MLHITIEDLLNRNFTQGNIFFSNELEHCGHYRMAISTTALFLSGRRFAVALLYSTAHSILA